MTRTTKTMTTKTTDSSSRSVRLSPRRAALIAVASFVLLVAAGCSPSGDTATDTTPTNSPPASVTSTTPDSGDATTPDSGKAANDIDPGELLSQALALYEDGYQFGAVAEVAGSEAAKIAGVVIGQSAQMDVTSGDATISYIITPDGSWIQTEGGEWQEVEASGPIERPLANMASPTSITIVSAGDRGIAAIAAYDGAAFNSDEAIKMNLTFLNGLLVKASYETANASVSTTFSPLDGATIENPGPSA